MQTSFRYLIGRKKELEIKFKCLFFTTFFFLIFPYLSIAGNFKISPINIKVDTNTKTTVFKITNQGDEKVTVQLDVKEWRQNETGPDTFKQTTDIVFFPKIVTIEKDEKQIIRIGYQGDENVAMEKTYKMFVEELPVNIPGETALRFTLKLVVPIIVTPFKELKEFSIEKIQFSGGKLTARIKNSGNVYFTKGKITAVGLDSLDKEVFKTDLENLYVLAGVARAIDIDIKKENCRKSRKLKVALEVDGIIKRKELILDKAQCADNKENEKQIGGKVNK